MDLKITPEDLVPDFNRRLLECTANLIAHTASGATEAAEAWRRAAEAMVEVGKACERINAKLATLTVDYAAPIKTGGMEALAQPKEPAARDPALDGDAKTTTGPREDFSPLHPDMFGGTDYPGALP